MKDVNMITLNTYSRPNVISIDTSKKRHRNVEIIQKARQKNAVSVCYAIPHIVNWDMRTPIMITTTQRQKTFVETNYKRGQRSPPVSSDAQLLVIGITIVVAVVHPIHQV